MMGHEMTNGSHEMMMGGSHGMMEGMGTAFFGFLLLAAVLLFAVIAGAILLVRALWKPQNQAPQVNNAAATPSAVETLEQRYARGDIDDDEFDRRRRALGKTS